MNNKQHLPFKPVNYKLMLAGIALLVLGFFMMSLDKEPYGFGFLGITLGPIVVVAGFIVEFFAILYRSRK